MMNKLYCSWLMILWHGVLPNSNRLIVIVCPYMPWSAPFPVKPPMCQHGRAREPQNWPLVESLSSNVGRFTRLSLYPHDCWCLPFIVIRLVNSYPLREKKWNNILICMYRSKGLFLQCKAFANLLNKVAGINSFLFPFLFQHRFNDPKSFRLKL